MLQARFCDEKQDVNKDEREGKPLSHLNVFIQQEMEVFTQDTAKAAQMRERITPEMLVRIQKMNHSEANLYNSLKRLYRERETIVKKVSDKKNHKVTKMYFHSLGVLDDAITRTQATLENSKRMKDEVMEWVLSSPHPVAPESYV